MRRGTWETFLIATVDHPAPQIRRALVIVGSDRRGAAFGAYELSRSIGVSPWVWWADVRPQRRDTLIVAPGTHRYRSPSVRYRGIFINDEDWGLNPWAAQTFDPDRGNIGPKTYVEVFRLLLRLKANTLWPAMHKSSAPFNSDPENARLADEYAIVMGSSHAEPMLRNNVGEWKDHPSAFNYASNAAGVHAYWEERVRTNARYESLWTLGMRGIHDSGMVGVHTTAEKVALLERVIGDQRRMLSAHIGPDLRQTPQIFVPYKEVLDLYRAGVKVPDDVTIVWPDDNFGYIRQFPTAIERARPGGAGVYYHLSYLDAPLAYLWLSTTPPALIKEEMTRAYDLGARTLWVANVGDIKPAEIGTNLFLDIAWDIDRWRGHTQRSYLTNWSARTFGRQHATRIAALLDEHFRINFERRPEHLQWWLPGERPRSSALSVGEINERLRRFDALVHEVIEVAGSIEPRHSDAYFELVEYPVRAAAAANRRFFKAERYSQLIDLQPEVARAAARDSLAADEEIKALTARFNNEVAGGKWRHIMAEEPADNQWPTFRISRLNLPAPSLLGATVATSPPSPQPHQASRSREAEDFVTNRGWRLVEGLGRGAGTMFAAGDAARITYRIDVDASGGQVLELGVLPLFPSGGENALLLEIAIDKDPSRMLRIEREVETPSWSQGVLDNLLWVAASDTLPSGTHDVTIVARGNGLALDQLRVRRAPAENDK